MDSIAAKQFIISRVIEQAQLDHLVLSEIERKMLHFTEMHATLPDIYQVNEEFERDYDSDEYETKIIELLKRARARDETASSIQTAQWHDAIEALKDEDHYILVIIYRAFPDYRKAILPTHRVRDYVLYIAIGVGVVMACIFVAFEFAGR